MSILIDASPPARNHIATLKKVGYSFVSAVGDIVDNSISAEATRIDIVFLPLEGYAKFIIIDDGFGMSPEELRDNMVIGCKDPEDERPKGDLGRFGSGLKTASFSQAKILSVGSKTNVTELAVAKWDTELVQKENKWLLQVLEEKEIQELDYIKYLQQKPSGTLVCWENLTCIETDDNARSIPSQIATFCDTLHEYLGLYFHRFLAGKNKVEIFINRKSVEAHDPFMRHINGYEEGPGTSFRSKKGAVHIQSHILPRFNKMTSEQIEAYGGNRHITQKQGLYIYRDKRLIIEGDWLGLASSKELSNLARIQIDIPSTMDDEWATDLKKSSLKLPPKIRAALKRIIGSPMRSAGRVHTYAGKKDRENDYWSVREDKVKETIHYEVNSENDALKMLFDKLPSSEKNILSKYLSSVSKNVPINHIYATMSRSPKSIEQESVEEALSAILESLYE